MQQDLEEKQFFLITFKSSGFSKNGGNDQSWCGLSHMIFPVCKTTLSWPVIDNRHTVVVALWLDCLFFFLVSCVNRV